MAGAAIGLEERRVGPSTGTVDLAALGDWVRDRRTERGMDRSRFAEVAGVSRSSLIRLEHGPGARNGPISRPYPHTLGRVLFALDVTPAEATLLLGESKWTTDVAAWIQTFQAGGVFADTGSSSGSDAACSTSESAAHPSGGAVPETTLLHLRVPVGAVVTVSMA